MLARFHRTRRGSDEGFTLIELLVVMIIIGILAAIAVPVFLSQRQKAQDTAVKSDVTVVGKELATYYVDNIANLQAAIAGSKLFLCPTPGACTAATALATENVSSGTAVPTGSTAPSATIIDYFTGTGCTASNGWIVHLYNAGGQTKHVYYTAQTGLSTTAPVLATACS